MIITKKLQQVGNSCGIIIDKKVLDEMKLKKGDLIEASFRAPQKKNRSEF
jgi:antitoxin component of MazEF toxin-antitoxin module